MNSEELPNLQSQANTVAALLTPEVSFGRAAEALTALNEKLPTFNEGDQQLVAGYLTALLERMRPSENPQTEIGNEE